MQSEKSNEVIVQFTQPYTDLTQYELTDQDLYVYAEIICNGSVLYSLEPKQVFSLQHVNNIYSLSVPIKYDMIKQGEIANYKIKLSLGSLQVVNRFNNSSNVQPFEKIHVQHPIGIYPIIKDKKVQGIAYTEADQATSYTIKIENEVFRQPLTEDLQVEGIAIKKDTIAGYQLVISTSTLITRTAFSDFLTSLEQHDVLASGMYKIMELITRHAAINLSDVLYMYCKLTNEKRSVELRPGFGLQLETAVYQPIYDADSSLDAAPGYISMNRIEYQISSVKDNDDIKLEFNHFIQQFADNISINYQSDIFSGGVLDFFSNGMKQPYYKIIYPSSFLTSDLEGTNYHSDNVVIVATNSYSKLQEVENSLVTMNNYDQSAINTPVLIVRGRSAVVLTIKVFYQGQLLYVPIGTTLMNILESNGISDYKTVQISLHRLTCSGYVPMELYADVDMENYLDSIVLLVGDRIEVS